MISIQIGSSDSLVQNNDKMMTEKIQSTLVNDSLSGKSQMVIALGAGPFSAGDGGQAQREVTNMTNELLKKNADALKMGTIETAKESERGIVWIETLKYTNESLISTLDEVVKIQTEGRQKRVAAGRAALGRIENELKQKLLNINS